jgi:hypothetical protein
LHSVCTMNERRVRELKLQYVIGLIEILQSICDAGEPTEEHAEAVRQVQRALLSCLEFPLLPNDPFVDLDHFQE